MAKRKEYTGSAYIGVVGGESDVGVCRDSILAIRRKAGDDPPRPIRATKGYEARQAHLESFYNETKHAFCLLLDHDETFPVDTLERLRSHKLPYVSGLYMRRMFPTYPVWYKPPPRHVWPMEPWTGPVERGKLHKLGGSGWGCILVHRDVLTAVAKILKGEDWVLEDDMDIWPYDLGEVMGALCGLRELVSTAPPIATLRPALAAHVGILSQELRPLRGRKTMVGSDLRFPFYAKEAGFQLWGDPDVRCGHVINYPISPDDYDHTPAGNMAHLVKKAKHDVRVERKAIRADLEALR